MERSSDDSGIDRIPKKMMKSSPAIFVVDSSLQDNNGAVKLIVDSFALCTKNLQIHNRNLAVFNELLRF